MGFFDKLFGGSVSKKEVSLSNLDAWLDDEFSKLNDRTVKETKPLIEEIFEVKDSLRKRVLDLQDLSCEELPARLKTIVKTSKPEYVSSMLDILDAIEFDEKAGYKNILEFQGKLPEMLEKIAKAMAGHGRYLPFAYGDALAGIRKDVKNLIDLHRNLSRMVESYGRITLLEKIRTAKGDLESAAVGRKIVKSKANSLKKELKELGKDLADAIREREQILADKQSLELGKQLEADRQKLDGIKTTAYEGWASLGRPLRKYKRLAMDENRLPQSDLKNIDGFMENPVEQFLSGTGFQEILEDMEKAINEGKIEIKNPEKTVKSIRDITASLKPSLIDEYNMLAERKKKIESELENSIASRQGRKLEALVEQLKNKISEKNGELETLEKKGSELEASMNETRKQLKTQLEEFKITLLDSQ
ncbi:MAG: hypothetical protein FJY77_05245 [Candidatus Altiarchaeales archaeon]|nr:hypothetical protein [Candidatus Altiarchaeales archaeon]